MTAHEWLNKLTVVYGHAYDCKKHAVDSENKSASDDDVICEMQEILYRIDALSKRIGERMNRGG